MRTKTFVLALVAGLTPAFGNLSAQEPTCMISVEFSRFDSGGLWPMPAKVEIEGGANPIELRRDPRRPDGRQFLAPAVPKVGKEWKVVVTYGDGKIDILPIDLRGDVTLLKLNLVAVHPSCNDTQRDWVAKDGDTRAEHISKYIIARRLAAVPNCRVADHTGNRSQAGTVLAWFNRSCTLAQQVANMSFDMRAKTELEKIPAYRVHAATYRNCVRG